MAKIKVLIVEDEAITAYDIREMLEELGYEVTALAHSGEVALRSFQKELPDLVLMDIVLKGEIDGIQVAQEMNRIEAVPIIYLTGQSDQETKQRAKSTNYAHYALKPLNPPQLAIDIEEVLEKFTIASNQEQHADKNKMNNIFVFTEHLFIKKHQPYEKVHKNEIEYIVGDGNLSTFHIVTGRVRNQTKKNTFSESVVLPHSTFKEQAFPPIYAGLNVLETRLAHFKNLVRIHRKFIINISHVKSFTRKEVKLFSCTLPIGKTHYQEFINRLDGLM